MWSRIRSWATIDRQFDVAVAELLESTTRLVILVVGGAYLTWYLLVREHFSTDLHLRFFAVTVMVVLTCLATWQLLPRSLLLSHVVFLSGLAATITVASVLLRQPEATMFYILLPLAATVTIGWWAGALAEAVVVGLLWWLAAGAPALPLSASAILATSSCGAITCALGWASTRSLVTVVGWSLFSYEQAQQKMEELREHQVELKQTQEDLIQANRQLSALSDRLKAMQQLAEEAYQAKADFVARVSHELRTPLNMIIGFSDLITQSPEVYGDPLPPSLLADVTAIRRNSQHLARLIDDVLDLSQVDAGRMALSKEWVSIPDIVREAIEAVSLLFKSKGISLEVDLPPTVPSVYCDGTRIRQVLINLVGNSGRFTEQGKVCVKVEKDGERIIISVADTGPGISTRDQARLFEPFEQLDSSIRRRHGGSGLGLSISRRFVEMHGGQLWLESTVGVGTTIYFSLPIDPSASSRGDVKRWFNPYSDHEFTIRTRRSKTPPAKPTPRFVIVEKGQTLRHLFERYVDNADIVAVPNLDQAIAELSRTPAQALIWNAPPPAGQAETISALHLPFATPAITCWVPGKDEAAERLGVVDYLVKPITREMLLSTLARLGDDIRTILVVDDDRETLRLFSRMLATEEGKYRVLWATSGQRALRMLRERHPNLMLLDLIMPEMDGFRVLQEKNKDTTICNIPVVVISSRDPTGEPIISDRLTVTRSGGLSVRTLLACIQTLSDLLAPHGEPAGGGQIERLPA